MAPLDGAPRAWRGRWWLRRQFTVAGHSFVGVGSSGDRRLRSRHLRGIEVDCLFLEMRFEEPESMGGLGATPLTA